MLKFKPKFLESSSKSTYGKNQYYKPKYQSRCLQAFDEFVFVSECQIRMSMCILTILATRPILKLKYNDILEILTLSPMVIVVVVVVVVVVVMVVVFVGVRPSSHSKLRIRKIALSPTDPPTNGSWLMEEPGLENGLQEKSFNNKIVSSLIFPNV